MINNYKTLSSLKDKKNNNLIYDIALHILNNNDDMTEALDRIKGLNTIANNVIKEKHANKHITNDTVYSNNNNSYSIDIIYALMVIIEQFNFNIEDYHFIKRNINLNHIINCKTSYGTCFYLDTRKDNLLYTVEQYYHYLINNLLLKDF